MSIIILTPILWCDWYFLTAYSACLAVRPFLETINLNFHAKIWTDYVITQLEFLFQIHSHSTQFLSKSFKNISLIGAIFCLQLRCLLYLFCTVQIWSQDGPFWQFSLVPIFVHIPDLTTPQKISPVLQWHHHTAFLAQRARLSQA